MADPAINRQLLPIGSQFPSKFQTLPDISGLTTSLPQISDSRLIASEDNRLMPYQGRRSEDIGERLMGLENKILLTERSNRVLLEEVVRLQSELKNSSRRAEEAIRDERNSRISIENTVRTNNDLISHLQMRLKRHEDKVNDDLGIVSDLVSQSKSLERSVLSNHHEYTSRRDLQSTKFDEIKREVEESIRGRKQLEHLTYQLQDEIRLLKSRVDNEVGELSNTAKDLKGWSKKLEFDCRETASTVRKQNESANQVGMSTVQLKSQVETRLSELRDVIIDLRTRHDHEIQERRSLEKQIQKRFHDMQSEINEQIRHREEAIHALDVMTREKEHTTETERLKMQSRLSEMVEELAKKVTRKDLKLREDTQERFIQLEKFIHEEKSERQEKERTLENSLEQTIYGVRKKQNDDINMIREQNKGERAKMNESLKKLDVAVTLLEEHISAGQKQVDKLLAAEIKSRKQHERDTRERVDHLQEKLGLATATLQEAVGGISSQVSSLADQIRRDVSVKVDERHSAALRHMNDLDTRLLSFNAKLTQMEDKLDGRISAASSTLSENMRQKMKDLLLRFDVLSKTVEEMKRTNDQLPREIFEVGEKLAISREDMDARIKMEIENRVSDVEDVRRELIKFSQGEAIATMRDIDKCQATIRRLGETIQTVKAVLGLKIQHEEKTRVEEMSELRDDVGDLRSLIEPFLENTQPRLFIKPAEGTMTKYEAEASSPSINKWTFYNAVRWLDYKSKWKYMLFKAAQDAQQKPPRTQSQASEQDDKSPSPAKSQPASPKSKPGSPKSKPESPKSKPESPKSQPASPKSEAGTPKSKSGSPKSKPSSPTKSTGTPEKSALGKDKAKDEDLALV